jgi:hypothetical protein
MESFADEGYGAVADVFSKNFKEFPELGARSRGRAGGSADHRRTGVLGLTFTAAFRT